PDLSAALRLAEHARTGPFEILALELFSEACLQEVEKRGRGRSPLSARAGFYALLEVAPLGGAELDRWLTRALEEGLVVDGVRASSAAQARSLWALRENITES